MKYIIFDMEDGSRWKMPADVVIKNAADYYFTNKSTKDEFNGDYDLAVKEVESWHDEDLVDWLLNNMDWFDINPHIEMIDEPQTYDYSRKWQDADIYVD